MAVKLEASLGESEAEGVAMERTFLRCFSNELQLNTDELQLNTDFNSTLKLLPNL